MQEAEAQTQVRQRGQPRRLFSKDGAAGAHRSPPVSVGPGTVSVAFAYGPAFRTSPCALQVRMALSTTTRSTSTRRSLRSRRRPPNRAENRAERQAPLDCCRRACSLDRLRISLTSWAASFGAGSAWCGRCSTRPAARPQCQAETGCCCRRCPRRPARRLACWAAHAACATPWAGETSAAGCGRPGATAACAATARALRVARGACPPRRRPRRARASSQCGGGRLR